MEAKNLHSIRLDGKAVYFTIRRSRRAKRIRMTIEDGGHLSVTVPMRSRLQDVPPVLRTHRKWILKKLGEAEKKKLVPPFEIRNGTTLKMLDFSYRLLFKPSIDGRTRWRFYHGALNISSRQFSPSVIYECIESWYRKMAQIFLEESVSYWAERINVSPKSIRVKNQKTLWGSCSAKRNLNFNWRIMLLSRGAAEYLLIHELAHMREPNHSPRFWQLVEIHCPDFKKHKIEIKKKSPWLRFPDSHGLRKEP